MEICQSCSNPVDWEKFTRVQFGVTGGVTRSWAMCPHCTDVLQDMVLGYMGELPPGDEEQRCETCRGYSPLLLGCTKLTQPSSESCRKQGFDCWQPKKPEPNGTGWAGEDYTAWFDGELPFAEEPCHCGTVL